MTSLKSTSISLLILPVCLLLSSHLSADTVYKSTDKNGKITYSSTPTDNHTDSVRINLPPPPTETAIKAAQERHQKNLETDKILEEARQQRSQEIAEQNRIRLDKKERAEARQAPKDTKEEGPYYGIPGRGILVLPKGPRIGNSKVSN